MDAVDVSRVLADALEAAGIPYAIGGAVAYGYWADPRGTHDVDLNIFLPAGQARAALNVLVGAGLNIDPDAALRSGDERGDARGTFKGMRVDVFFNSIPLHDSAAKRAQRRNLLGAGAWILSAEDLIVLKLMFNRGKDYTDIERIVAFQRERLDRRYVRKWIVDMVGPDDIRVTKWDDLCHQLPA